jgi:hypothetical protein
MAGTTTAYLHILLRTNTLLLFAGVYHCTCTLQEMLTVDEIEAAVPTGLCYVARASAILRVKPLLDLLKGGRSRRSEERSAPTGSAAVVAAAVEAAADSSTSAKAAACSPAAVASPAVMTRTTIPALHAGPPPGMPATRLDKVSTTLQNTMQ